MKAIVIDIEGKHVIVLTEKGDFKKINYKSRCRIGDEIELIERNRIFSIPEVWSIYWPAKKIVAAVIIFFLLFGLGGYAIADYMTPMAFVTIDINPSLELTINRYERVLKVETFNDDASILAGVDGIKNMRLEDAVKRILDRAEDKHYLDSDSALIFTVSGTKEGVSQKIETQLRQTAEESVRRLTKPIGIARTESALSLSDPTQPGEKVILGKAKPGIQIIVQSAPIEKHKEASKKNISVGKLLMYESLKDINPEVTLEEVKKSPVSKLIEEIRRDITDKKDNPVPKKQKSSAEEKSKTKSKDQPIIFTPDKELSIPDRANSKAPAVTKPSVINSEKILTEHKNYRKTELKVLDHSRENPGKGGIVHPAGQSDTSTKKSINPDRSNKKIPKSSEEQKEDTFKKTSK